MGNLKGSHIQSFLRSSNFLNKRGVLYDEYDEPTYMGFWVEFPDIVQPNNIASQNFDELPNGLLHGPSADYSAERYLRNINEPKRAKLIANFRQMLRDLTTQTPYYITEIGGLDSIYDLTPGQNFRADAEITLNLLEGIDTRISAMFDFYRKAAYDEVYHRWLLPDIMRNFRMNIYISEFRRFHIPKNNERIEPNGNKFNISISDLIDEILPPLEDEGHFLEELNENFSIFKFELSNCEFNLETFAPSWKDGVNNTDGGDAITNSVSIKVGNIKESNQYTALEAIFGENLFRVDSSNLQDRSRENNRPQFSENLNNTINSDVEPELTLGEIIRRGASRLLGLNKGLGNVYPSTLETILDDPLGSAELIRDTVINLFGEKTFENVFSDIPITPKGSPSGNIDLDGQKPSDKITENVDLDGNEPSDRITENVDLDGNEPSEKINDNINLDGDSTRRAINTDNINFDGTSIRNNIDGNIDLSGKEPSERITESVDLDGKEPSERITENIDLDGNESKNEISNNVELVGNKPQNNINDNVDLDGVKSSENLKDSVNLSGAESRQTIDDNIGLDGNDPNTNINDNVNLSGNENKSDIDDNIGLDGNEPIKKIDGNIGLTGKDLIQSITSSVNLSGNESKSDIDDNVELEGSEPKKEINNSELSGNESRQDIDENINLTGIEIKGDIEESVNLSGSEPKKEIDNNINLSGSEPKNEIDNNIDLKGSEPKKEINDLDLSGEEPKNEISNNINLIGNKIKNEIDNNIDLEGSEPKKEINDLKLSGEEPKKIINKDRQFPEKKESEPMKRRSVGFTGDELKKEPTKKENIDLSGDELKKRTDLGSSYRKNKKPRKKQ